MEMVSKIYHNTLLVMAVMMLSLSSYGQYCDSITPSFIVDLSSAPNLAWVSDTFQRDGLCCGAQDPDNCLEFILTLHPSTIAINFNIASGAVPPGALFYQIGCGPITPVGEPICLNGPGPHHLTFCKPGNNQNSYSIDAISEPIVGPDLTLNAGCQNFIFVEYYDESSITWTSIYPGAQGAYDNLLGCTAGCDTTMVTAPTVNPPAYVDYLVCGNDLGGCNPNPICDTIRVNFIQPVEVTINSAVTSVCTGETATMNANVTGGTGPYTYQWSTGSTATSITMGPGQYFVDVLDASGCITATDTFTLIENLLPPVAAGPDVSVCEGTSVMLSGAGAVTYSWTGGVVNANSFYQNVGTQNYTVTGTDANGCSATDIVQVVVNPIPAVNAGPDQAECFGTPITLTATGADTYNWNNGVSNGVPFNQGQGTVTYTVVGTTNAGCQFMDQVDVTINALPIVDAGPNQELCENTPVTLQAAGAVSYTWNNGVVDGVPFTQAPGSVYYTVTGVDINGCTDDDIVGVTINALPVVSAGTDVEVCEGTYVTLQGYGAQDYSWSNNIINGVQFLPPVGVTEYTVTGTDANDCVNTDNVMVTVNPVPYVDAGEDQLICEKTNVTLSAQSNAPVTWNNGITNNQPFEPQVGSTTYIVTAAFPSGCQADDQVVIHVFAAPIVTADDVVACENEEVVLKGEGAQTYVWSDGVIDNQAFIPNRSGYYYVTGTDANGCKDSDSAQVVINPAPDVDFIIQNMDLTSSAPSTGFTNLTTGGVDFLWDFGHMTVGSTEFEPFHTFPFDESGEYAITLTSWSEAGCMDQKVKYIHVFQDYSLYVPNAFTPDQDDYNEVFKPVMSGIDKFNYVMYIYNRWGQLVFESHNPDVGWDGTYAGQDFEVQDGVYTWKIEAQLEGSTDSKIFVGHVSLIQ